MKATISAREFEMLSAYIDGQLPAKDVRRLEARLRASPELNAALDEMRHTRLLLRQSRRRRAPRSFALTPAMVGEARRQRSASPFWFPAFGFASAMAALLLVIVLAVQLAPGSPIARSIAMRSSNTGAAAPAAASDLAATQPAALLAPGQAKSGAHPAATATPLQPGAPAAAAQPTQAAQALPAAPLGPSASSTGASTELPIVKMPTATPAPELAQGAPGTSQPKGPAPAGKSPGQSVTATPTIPGAVVVTETPTLPASGAVVITNTPTPEGAAVAKQAPPSAPPIINWNNQTVTGPAYGMGGGGGGGAGPAPYAGALLGPPQGSGTSGGSGGPIVLPPESVNKQGGATATLVPTPSGTQPTRATGPILGVPSSDQGGQITDQRSLQGEKAGGEAVQSQPPAARGSAAA
ncbi:MAG TPA: hypothetical protein VF832_05890, partial [Longimicrobiales bacterium]